MAEKSKNNYFEMVDELVGYSLEGARSLYKTLSEFDSLKLEETTKYLHNIEHTADLKKHDLMEKLLREFITPIDSGDLFQLAQEVDDVTDAVEEVLNSIHMYNVTKLRPEVVPFAETVVKCVETLKSVTSEFGNFRKSTTLKGYIVEVNRLEEVGDKHYTDAMHRLFRDTSNGAELLIWKDIFGTLEECCDECEHVADVVESVIMKNT
jgi:Phosphate transport regulator (distant homolog of PhoU)